MYSLRYRLRLTWFSILLLRELARPFGRPRVGPAILRFVFLRDLLRARFDVPIVLWWPFFVSHAIRNLGAPSPDESPDEPAYDPDDFPPEVPRVPAHVENFTGDEGTRAYLYHAIPWNAEQLRTIAAWAECRGPMRVRPIGNRHTWSPATLQASAPPSALLDMRRFDEKTIDTAGEVATFGAGVTIEEASLFLHQRRRAFPCMPAIGDVTIGGVLSTGAHGTAFGVGKGTINATVRSIDVVAWDGTAYVERTFHPGSEEFAAVTLGLGAVLIVRASFEVVPSYGLVGRRTRFFLERYLADEGARWEFPMVEGSVRLATDLDETPARVELFWFPHQGRLRGQRRMRILRRRWMEGDAPSQPSSPYRDALVNWATQDTDEGFRDALSDANVSFWWRSSPLGRRFQTLLSLTGLRAADREDSHGGRLYASKFILRYHCAGWCIVVERSDAHAVLREAAHRLQELQAELGSPLDGPIEVRITDLDRCDDRRAAMSPCRAPDGSSAELCALWFNVLTTLSERAGKVLQGFELWLRRRPRGVVSVRPEWTKGWGYDSSGKPWRDEETIRCLLEPFDRFEVDSRRDVARVLRGLDPAGIFLGPLAEQILFRIQTCA